MLQIRRNEFAKKFLDFLKEEGFEINWGDILTNVNGSLGRLHIAYAMKKKGIVKKVSDAFDKYLNPFKEKYENQFEFNTIDVIKLINNAGGPPPGSWEDWKTDDFLSQQRGFLKPLWDRKKSLKGKRILVWSEQGVGDTINWSSCLSHLTSQADYCILECQEKIVSLLARSFPNIEIRPEDRSMDSKRDDFDFHLPMGSLYRHFIPHLSENSNIDAYLVPDPVRVKFWRDRLGSLGKGPFIGLSWKSSMLSPYRLKHYPPISEWSSVLSVPDVTFINLQYTDFAEDLIDIKNGLGVTVHNFDDLDQYNDVDDVAALCAALDMVVSTKVTPLIFSSGVGTPTKVASWRQSIWNSVLTNPVCSSAKMFNRDTWESWDNVFKSIAEDILQLKN